MRTRLTLAFSFTALAVAVLGSTQSGQAVSTTPGISGYEIVSRVSPFDATDGKLVSAQCPAGKKVVGGGATVNPAIRPIALLHSTARHDGRTWTAIAREYAATAYPWSLSVRAICANAT